MTTLATGLAGRPSARSGRSLVDWLRHIGPTERAWRLFRAVMRRRGWFLENLSPRKMVNLASTGLSFALKREVVRSFPTAVKIDISPLCNLRCTHCVHAEPHGREPLEDQDFRGCQRMSLGQYRRIINEIRGKVSAVSLYYLGDPLVHPDLDEMCRIAHDAGLSVHVSTNFSLPLTDERLRRIIESGVTHFTVCVDGLTQEKYERTRVGGRIELVLSNLRRLCRIRRELGRTTPKIEVQYIMFQHNADEVEQARAMAAELGVDNFATFWGSLVNCTDRDFGTLRVDGPMAKKSLPRCYFPHTSMLIKYNGDVIPCCCYRLGDQYARSRSSPTMGNVFQTSVRAVWNSPEYRAARRMVSDPTSVERDPSLQQHFCYGCPYLFHTDFAQRERRGDRYAFDEFYSLNERRRPVPRRPGVPTRRPCAAEAELVSVG